MNDEITTIIMIIMGKKISFPVSYDFRQSGQRSSEIREHWHGTLVARQIPRRGKLCSRKEYHSCRFKYRDYRFHDRGNIRFISVGQKF